MQTVLQDLRYGARMLLRTPGVTLVAIIALTLGIGANTVIFSAVHAVLLRSFPYQDGERLAIVWEHRKRADRNNPQNVINLGNFFDWKDQNSVFTDMAAFFDLNVNLTGDGSPEEVPGQVATPNLFSLLGVNPIMGRTFAPDDGKPGQNQVVVIGYDLWQRRFGGDPSIVGRKVTINNEPNEVIGVLPPNVGWFVQKNSMVRSAPQIWSPWQVSENLRKRQGRFARAVARLKPGVTFEQAQNEMQVIGARLEQQYPEFNTNWGVNVVPLRTQVTGEIRKPLLILLGAVGFVLLIACANVANLLLARATSRRKEIALRAGLGASRWRIARQLLTESILLSVIGGVSGLMLAWWGTRALLALSPPELMDLRDTSVNLPVLGFTMGLTLLTGIVFGLVPALQATRVDLNESLKEGGRGGQSGSHRVRSAFVVTQVALALVLLVGAGLLIRSLSQLNSVAPGFNPDKVLTVRVNLPGQKYDSDAKVLTFFQQAVGQLKSLPGVESAAAINYVPFGGLYSGTGIHIEGQPEPPPGQRLGTGVVVTDVNYFATMGIPLKRGRLFTEQEATEMRHVVVVNETFARQNFPGQDPIGKRVTIDMKEEGENVPNEIIGIVGDNKHKGLDAEVEPMAFWPHPELVYSSMTLLVRTKGDPTGLATAARNVIHQIDPDQPVGEVNTMQGLMATSIAKSRFNTILLTVFSAVALVMAAVGIYGVMSYSVQQRTHELGIRMALGAQYLDVLRLILKQGIVLGVIGVAVGLLGSFGLTRLMTTLLFEVTPTDLKTFAAVSVGLFAIVLIACYIPARRATKVNPLVALRYE